MQNYLCKRLHNHYIKLPFSYNKSASYRVILDKNYPFLNVVRKGYFLQKSYKYRL